MTKAINIALLVAILVGAMVGLRCLDHPSLGTKYQCTEDMECWNPATMGNGRGSITAPPLDN